MTERDQDDQQPQPDGGFKVHELEDDVEGHRFHGALTEERPAPEGGFKIKAVDDEPEAPGPENARHF